MTPDPRSLGEVEGRARNLLRDGCAVRGCRLPAAFTLTRQLPSDHFPKSVLLAYCPEHYGAANRFHDRRPLQASA